MARSNRRTATLALSIALFIVIWQILASAVDDRVLPGPAAVLRVLWLDTVSGELAYHLGVTLARVAVSFGLAMIVGSSIGLVMGRSARVDRFFDSWLILFLNIPALVTIVLCYVWFGLSEVAAVTAVAINKIPNVVVTIREGARALDPAYAKLARVYRLGRWQTLRHIVLPQLAPFLRPRPAPDWPWSGRSSWWLSSWDAATGSDFNCISFSSCSTCRVSWPIRSPSWPSCRSSN